MVKRSDTVYSILRDLRYTQEGEYLYIGQPVYDTKYFKRKGINIIYTNGEPGHYHIVLRNKDFEFESSNNHYQKPERIEFDYIVFIDNLYVYYYFENEQELEDAFTTVVNPGDTVEVKTTVKIENIILHYDYLLDKKTLTSYREETVIDNLDNITIKSNDGQYNFTLTQIKPLDYQESYEKEKLYSFGNVFNNYDIYEFRGNSDLKITHFGVIFRK